MPPGPEVGTVVAKTIDPDLVHLPYPFWPDEPWEEIPLDDWSYIQRDIDRGNVISEIASGVYFYEE